MFGFVRIITCLLLVCCFLLISAGAHCGEPTEVVKKTIEQARVIFSSKKLTQNEKIDELRKIAEDRFDFEEMARRSLAGHWKKLSPDEKREFTTLFSKLIEETYSRKLRRYEKEIREHMRDNVIYLGERINGPFAKVNTEILTLSGIAVPVDYSFVNKGGKWLAYDVTAEHVSLVNNYRSQFSEILRNGSYEELVRRLRLKSAE